MTRLDAALADRGLARSRTHAARLIADGLVTVNGRGIVKASHAVTDTDEIAVAGADHYVSRAAHKLIAALDAFQIDPTGRTALDMGASTGGFTQVLRKRGASAVMAVDVGHDQLDAQIAADPGVHAVEGFNVRYMTPENLAAATGITERPTLVTGDLSFISLDHVLPAVAATAAPGADIVLLIKPQFEVGPHNIGKGGIVRDPTLYREVEGRFLDLARQLGLTAKAWLDSPITGGGVGNIEGNREFFIWLKK